MAILAFALVGLFVGLFFTAVAAIITAVAGQFTTHTGEVVSFLAMANAYVVGGLAGGVITGWMRPLMTRRVGAAFVGVLGLLPMFVAVVFIYEGSWAEIDWFFVAVGTTLVGGPLGLVIRTEYRKTLEEFGWSKFADSNSA